MSLLVLEQNVKPEYIVRTERNVQLSDVTIAFVTNMETDGMRATANLCLKHKRPLYVIDLQLDTTEKAIETTALRIATATYNRCYAPLTPELIINIAGNGIYELMGSSITQNDVDVAVYNTLRLINVYLTRMEYPIVKIRSGGQSGVDEAGLKASWRLGILTIGHFPRGFKIRDIDGIDREYSEDETRIRITGDRN